MPVMTDAGLALIATHHAAETVLDVDRIVLANIVGLDTGVQEDPA